MLQLRPNQHLLYASPGDATRKFSFTTALSRVVVDPLLQMDGGVELKEE